MLPAGRCDRRGLRGNENRFLPAIRHRRRALCLTCPGGWGVRRSVWEWSEEDLFAEYEMNEAVESDIILDEEGDEDFVC